MLVATAATTPPPTHNSQSRPPLPPSPQMLAFATQQASLLQQALPFMLPVCPEKVSAKLAEVLDMRLGARGAISHLTSHGYTEQQAERACLDYYNAELAPAPGNGAAGAAVGAAVAAPLDSKLDGKKLLKWVRARPCAESLNRWELGA